MSLDQVTFEEKLRQTAKIIRRLLKSAKSRVVARQETLDKCRHWESLYHQGILIQSNLFRIQQGMTALVVADWEQEGKERSIPLDPFIPLKDQLKLLFRQSKKLQKGIPYSEIQLQLAEKELLLRTQALDDFEKITTEEQLDAFCQAYKLGPESQQGKSAAVKQIEPAKPYRVYTSKAGLHIWVGKSARENDLLSFHYANGLDWWLHAGNCPGSHVVIRGTNGEEPDSDTLYDAAELALRFSKNKECREGEVTLTQVKFIKSIKHTPGKVMVSKHRTLKIRADDARWNRLRNAH
ncbi:MAG: NFACT RNA binding domain-containing protein [Parachlamydiaceae bacterium]